MKRILLILLMGLCALPAWADWNVQANGTSPVALTVPASQSGYCGLAVRQNYPVSGTSVSFTVWVGATLSGGGTSVGARQPYVFPCVGSATYAGGTTVGWIQVNQPGTYLFTVSGTYPSTLGGGNNGSVAAVSGTPNQIDVANPTTAPTVSLDPALQLPGTVALGAGASAVPTGSTLDITATGNSAFGTINANGFFQTNLPNDSGTPTVAATTVCENSSGNAQQCGANVKSHVIGVCVSGCGATGYPKVAIRGAVAGQAFDATHAVAAGDWVVTSATPGLGADTGSGTFPTCGNQVIGVATSSGSASTTQNVLMRPDSLPPCLTLGQLQGYVSTTQIGAVSVPLNAPAVSTDANGVFHAAAAGGGGIGGTVANTVGADGVANVVNFGATPATTTHDGAMANTSATFGATGSSTSPATPAGTTSFANEQVFVAYAFEGTLTAPSGPTQRYYLAASASNHDGLWMGDVNIASAGAYAAYTATQTTNPWTALAIPMIPTTGNTISPVGTATAAFSTSNQASVTVTKPTGVSTGNTLVACFSGYGGLPLSFGGWSRFAMLSNGNEMLHCYARIATASEPSTYTFKVEHASTEQILVGIEAYANVAAFDTRVTSATMAFTSGSVGKELCIAAPLYGRLTCGPIGIYSSATTVYPLFANVYTSALSAEVLIQGVDSSAAFLSAASALTNGGVLYAPTDTFIVTHGNLVIPYNDAMQLQGAGASLPVYWASASGGYYTPLAPRGTTIACLGDLAGDPFISFTNNPTANEVAFGINRVTDIGFLSDGSAGDGIDYNATHVVIERNYFNAFFNDGLYILGSSNGSGYGWSGNVDIRDNYADGNYQGLEIGGFTAQIKVMVNEFSHNISSGLWIDSTANFDNASFDANVFQWGPSCSITIAAPLSGTLFSNNWIDPGGAVCNTAPSGSGGGAWIANHMANNPAFLLTNSIYGMVLQGNFLAGTSWLSGTLLNPTVDATNMATTTTSAMTKAFSGSSGTGSCTENVQGGAVSVSCYLNGYAETGSAQTWTLPIPMAYAPLNSTAQTSCGTYNPSATTTTLSLPANAAMAAETCQVLMQGQTN